MVIAEVRALETRFVIDVVEDHRRAGERNVHRDRLVLFVVVTAMGERRIRADRRQEHHPSIGDLESARMIDLERHLHKRARLAEKDGRVDTGEGCLPQFGDGRLLTVTRLDLRPETLQLPLRGSGVVSAPADQLKRMGNIGHGNPANVTYRREVWRKASLINAIPCRKLRPARFHRTVHRTNGPLH